ncbi:hypothetical protein SAMN05192561_10296 [Halopenitus malekzadehii]|uniref:Uncharacterized protein n=2 Tax=Halopenitus malekzadehii TaxID=1267564 RepID=A0A1H6I9P5_9EURY|nr:hypothetical protein SAMN05192561_10296 [Halopenitus malekzadehii]
MAAVAGLSTLVATSGCLDRVPGIGGGDDGGFGAGTGSGTGDRRLELTLSDRGSTLRESHVRDLSETRDDVDEAAFDAALAGEAYTVTGRPPFHSTPEDPVYAERDGTYYRLDSIVVDESVSTHPVLRLFAVDADAAGEIGSSGEDSTTEAVGDPASAERLPPGDQRAVEIAWMAARARGNRGGVPWGLVRRGGYVYRSEDAIAASRLLAADGPDRVSYQDRGYSVSVSRERFHEPVYRARAEPVAESPEGIEAVLRGVHLDAVVSREDLSNDARNVILEARHGRYGESHPYSSAYEAVLRALHRRAYLDGNVRKDAGVDPSKRRHLRYDGEYFTYRLRFVDSE